MHRTLHKLRWASEGNSSHTLAFWHLHRHTRSQTWASRSAHSPSIISAWADFKPPPCARCYLHHVSCRSRKFAQAHGESQIEEHLLSRSLYTIWILEMLFKNQLGEITRDHVFYPQSSGTVLTSSLAESPRGRCLGGPLECYFTLAGRTSHVPLQQL